MMRYRRILLLSIFFLIASVRLEATPGPATKVGFEQGAFYFFGWAGLDLSAPNGSFIRHEKLYDKTQYWQIISKQINYIEPFSTLLPTAKSGPYTTGGLFGIGMEYAVNNLLGIGSSLSTTGVWAKRIQTYRDPRNGKLYLLPLGTSDERQLSLQAITLDLTYHVLDSVKFDPYISFRAGPTFASGIAHYGYEKDIDKMDEEIHNGRGIATGAGIGMNFYFSPKGGMKVEAAYMRYDFQADEFSRRSYYNIFINIGFFIKAI